MFCPKCKSLMYPKDENFICRKCDFQKKKSGRNVVKTMQKERDVMSNVQNVKIMKLFG